MRAGVGGCGREVPAGHPAGHVQTQAVDVGGGAELTRSNLGSGEARIGAVGSGEAEAADLELPLLGEAQHGRRQVAVQQPERLALAVQGLLPGRVQRGGHVLDELHGHAGGEGPELGVEVGIDARCVLHQEAEPAVDLLERQGARDARVDQVGQQLHLLV